MLSPEKFKFKVKSVKWMGHILGYQGLKADPARIKAMTEFPAPTSVPEQKRFLGMVGYLSRFLPNVSEVLAPSDSSHRSLSDGTGVRRVKGLLIE